MCVLANEAEDLSPTKYLGSLGLYRNNVCATPALPEIAIPPLICTKPVVSEKVLVPRAAELSEIFVVVPKNFHLKVPDPNS